MPSASPERPGRPGNLLECQLGRFFEKCAYRTSGDPKWGNDKRQAAWSSLVLLEGFRLGDTLAEEKLFSRYFERLKVLCIGGFRRG